MDEKILVALKEEHDALLRAERDCISEINKISGAEPPRGTSPDNPTSKKIKELDKRRQECALKRKQKREEIADAQGALLVLKRRKLKQARMKEQRAKLTSEKQEHQDKQVNKE